MNSNRGVDNRELHVPLDALTSASVDALVDAMALTLGAVGEAYVRQETPTTGKLALGASVHGVIENILRRAIDGASAVDDASIAAGRDALREAIAAARAVAGDGLDGGVPQFTTADTVETVNHAIVHESLEQRCASVRLVREGPQGWTVRWRPVSEEAAQLGLLEKILTRLNGAARTMQPVTAWERMASEWWFKRYSPTMDDPERARTRKIREREWSLTSRRLTCIQTTVLAFACENGYLAELEPRERRMAESAMKSRTGIFTVRKRSGVDATVEHAETLELLTLREHENDLAPRSGTTILGRLYPMEGGWYVRSPGAFVFGPWMPTRGRTLWSQLCRATPRSYPTEVALEWLVSTAELNRELRLPLDLPPASSREDARKRLNVFRKAMKTAGMFDAPFSKGALWRSGLAARRASSRCSVGPRTPPWRSGWAH